MNMIRIKTKAITYSIYSVCKIGAMTAIKLHSERERCDHLFYISTNDLYESKLLIEYNLRYRIYGLRYIG